MVYLLPFLSYLGLAGSKSVSVCRSDPDTMTNTAVESIASLIGNKMGSLQSSCEVTNNIRQNVGSESDPSGQSVRTSQTDAIGIHVEPS